MGGRIKLGEEPSSKSSHYRSQDSSQKRRKKKAMSSKERVAKHRSSLSDEEKQILNAITIARRKGSNNSKLELVTPKREREREKVYENAEWLVYKKSGKEFVGDGRVKNPFVAQRK